MQRRSRILFAFAHCSLSSETTPSTSSIHQSAQEYLVRTSEGGDQTVLHRVRYNLVETTFRTLASTLRRDIYQLGEFGYRVTEVRTPYPDPLATARYACVYWIEHLCDWLSRPLSDSSKDIRHVSRVLDEFMRKKYLYWLEALSLCGGVPEGVRSLGMLGLLVQVCSIRLYCPSHFWLRMVKNIATVTRCSNSCRIRTSSFCRTSKRLRTILHKSMHLR